MDISTIQKIEAFLNDQKNIFGDTLFLDLEQTTWMDADEIHSEIHSSNPISKHDLIINAESDMFTEIPGWKKSRSLGELYKKIHNCLECSLGNTRKNFVFGSGNPEANLMVIGEAPGADEDEQGEPFVGRAGQLLTDILKSVGFSRDEVYICNILKCRPPENRKPLPEESDKCEPYLHKQIELIKPAFILALGLTAADTLLKTKHKMGDIRGSVLNYKGIKMLVTYHPAALLRNPNWKKDVWKDMKLLRKLYDEHLLK